MSKDRIPYIEENTIDVAAAVNDSLRVVDGVVTDRVEAIVDELPQGAKQSDKYAVNAGDKAGLIAKFVESDAGGFWEYFDSVLCEYEGIVYVSDGKTWQEIKSNGGLPENILTTDDLHKTVDNTEDKAVTPKAVKDAIDAIDIPSMPDDYLTQDDVQQELSESYKPVSANAVKIAVDNINIGDVDLSEYRKLDNNEFNGFMRVKAESDIGTGVFLICPDGKVRGQMVYNNYGFQFTQVQEDGTTQTFTFPRYGDGGELAMKVDVDKKWDVQTTIGSGAVVRKSITDDHNTRIATAQNRADSAYNLANSKQDKLTFIGDGPKVMREGAYGVGVSGVSPLPGLINHFYTVQKGSGETEGLDYYYGVKVTHGHPGYFAYIGVGHGHGDTAVLQYSNGNARKYKLYNELNTTVDKSGFIRASGSANALTESNVANSLGTSTTLVASQKLVNDVNAKIPISTDINGVAMMRTNAIPTLTQSDMTDHVQAGLNQPVTSSGVFGALEELKQRIAALEAKLNEA